LTLSRSLFDALGRVRDEPTPKVSARAAGGREEHGEIRIFDIDVAALPRLEGRRSKPERLQSCFRREIFEE